jgi:hypothetical protein
MGTGVREEGGTMGSQLHARDQEGWGFAGTTFPSKGFFFNSHLNMYPLYHYNTYLCVLDKKKETLCAGQK